MTTRETMLANIKANQPDLQPLPGQFRFVTTYPDMAKQFADTLAFVGGLAVFVKDYAAISAYIREHFADVTAIATTLPELAHLADFDLNVTDPHDLAGLNLAIIEGQFAVAENAAIWVDERQLPHRVLPMITQYLAIVVRPSTLVANMHDAYDRLTVNETGFGTFISGPSKTADIEQSLVIGAHGARGLTVFVMT